MSDATSNGSSEIAALAQQVETARGKLPLQYDPALLEVLSEREIAAERELAEWIRAQRRKQRRREIEAELATELRDRKSAAALRRTDEDDARWHRRALAARRRVSSQDARLAQLYRRAEWSSRALIAVVVLGMVWAGVNVQHNLVPSGDMSDPLYWLSYGIEAMISIPIITIMVAATTAARWGRELARGKVIFFEAALLGTTVALNTGPHLAAGNLGRAAEYAIAPVMVGVVIWLHAWVSARYAVLIDGAPVVDRDAPIQIDAEHVSARSAYLDHGNAPANGGRFRWDAGADAPYPAGMNDTGAHRWAAATDRDAFTGTETRRNRSAASTAVSRPAPIQDKDTDPSPIERPVVSSPINSHATYRQTNGRPVENYDTSKGHPRASANHADDEERRTSTTSGRANGSSSNGHPVAAVDANAFPRANGYPLPRNHVPGDVGETSATSARTDEHRSNGHTVPPHANGHAFRQAANGHTVETSANGRAHSLVQRNTTTTGHTADTSDADEQPDGDVRDTSATVSSADGPSTNGHPVAAANGRAFPQPTNGHTAEPSSHGYAREIPVNEHTTPPDSNGRITPPNTNGHTGLPPGNGNGNSNSNGHDPAANGRALLPPTNGDTTATAISHAHNLPAATATVPAPRNGHTAEASSTNGYAHNLPADGYARTTANRPADAPAHNGSPVASVVAGQHATPAPGDRTAVANQVFDRPADVRNTRSTDTTAPQSFSVDADAFGHAVGSSSTGTGATMNDPEAPVASSPAPHREATKHPAAQRGSSAPEPREAEKPLTAHQISIEDLHGEFVLGQRSATTSTEGTAAAQPLSSSALSGHRMERAHGGFDGTGHASTGATEPTRTPNTPTTDVAAQANPNATAPRAAKRGKSVSAEQGDRTTDAESEQLTLNESPEPMHPHLHAEPMPILDEDDEDEDDELLTETDEADTNDDEISAIARAITGRRLSNLPLEEVREILTLADQGGKTPAIANELGVSRAAVTRVLDSAIRVHRPYLVIG
ncbi:hypothetical protein [Nocardia amamiensis]|uniref:hypothetical protein n=1 Tax=Nocardia amamiensis TaxID=404578 RepID=UPI00082CFFCD|nr:hypothetical protein [Nocardia amamiensis]